MAREFYLKDGVFGPHDTLSAPENVVRTIAQELSEPQKLQVRTNIGVTAGGIGAIAALDISDSTVAGRALLTAATAAAQRTALELAVVAKTGSYTDLTNIPAAGGMAIGNNVAGAAANRILHTVAGVLADNEGLTYSANRLNVGYPGITFGNVNNKIEGGTNSLHFFGANELLTLGNGQPVILGAWEGGGTTMVKGRHGGGYQHRGGSKLALAPGEACGSGAAQGIDFYYSTSGAPEHAINPLVLGASLSGAGVFSANHLAALLLAITPEPVGTLPTPTAGRIKVVNDATSTTPRSIAAGTGSNVCIVLGNGTNWLIV